MTDNMNLKSMFTLIAVLSGALTSQVASAQGIVYLANTNTEGVSISSTAVQVLVIPITTGSNAAGYTLNSIALLMATNSLSELISARLYDIASDSVATNMGGNRSNNFASATGGYNFFTPDSLAGDTSLLTANTIYYLSFFCVGFNGGPAPPFNVSFTSILPTGTDGWSYNNPDPLNNINPPVFDIIATPVTTVPEPSTLALAGLAGLAACWRCRWKQE